jgi:hypothetical protein
VPLSALSWAFAGVAVAKVPQPAAGITSVQAAPGTNTPSFNTPCTVNHKQQNCAQVRTIVQSGNTMFVGGGWASITDPVTHVTSVGTRTNLVAFDRVTGAVNTTFTAHTFNGMVRALAISPNSSTLYVGGEFTQVCQTTSGKKVCSSAQHLVALSLSSGAVLSAFQGKVNPAVTGGNGKVRALVVDAASDRLYLGGDFDKVEGQSHSRLAALSISSGAPIASFAPTFSIDTTQLNNVPAEITSLAVGPGMAGGPSTRIYAGGHFDFVNGLAKTTVVALNPASGGTDATFKAALQRQINPYDQNQEGMGLVIAPDGTVLMAQGGHYNRGYRFGLKGNAIWNVSSGGDLQTVALTGNTVYFGGHFICWSNGTPIDRSTCTTEPVPSYTVVRIHLAAVRFSDGALDINWAPLAVPVTANPYYYGVWKVFVSSSGDLYAGGVSKEIDVGTAKYTRPKLAIFPHL